jgi:aminopeptidase N
MKRFIIKKEMFKMREFIEELENNQKINLEKGLENRVDIDYVIERLKNISIYRELIKNEIEFNIENYVNDDCNDYQDKELIYNISDDDLDLMIDKIDDNDWLWDNINMSLNNAITDEIENYLNDKREEV